jgi:hypothetical protein
MVRVEGVPDGAAAARCGEGMRYVHPIDAGFSVYKVSGGQARYCGTAIMVRRLRQFNGA